MSPRHLPSPTPAPPRDSTSPIPQPASLPSAPPLILQSPAIPVASASPAGVASSLEPPTITSTPVSSESSEPNLGSAAVGTTPSKSNLGPPNPLNIFISRMIDDNKDVTDSECQKAWMALTKAEKQVYNKEATENQRAQRTSTCNMQSQVS
ncbi:hypothetical protein V8D89_007368 [Ganoderma adspersum]